MLMHNLETLPQGRLKNRLMVKKNIIEAATELFMTIGVESTTINDILLLSGVSRATFYVYYKSKQDILGDLLLQHYIEINDLISNIPQGLDFEIQIKEVVEVIASTIENKRHFLQIVFTGSHKLLQPSSPPLWDKDELERIVSPPERLTEIIQEGKNQNKIKNEVEAGEAATLLHHIIRGTLFQWVVGENEMFDLRHMLSQEFELAFTGMKNKDELKILLAE